jgi:alpha-ketoglutarate-dependent taurine dioxygenase
MKSLRLKRLDARESKRKTVDLSREALVDARPLFGESAPPFIIQPIIKDLDLFSWAKDNHEYLETQLLRQGALLLRGFNIKTAVEFERFILSMCEEVLEYKERSSPRSHVGGRIYSSTDYPSHQSIFPHNELSYALAFPLKLFFFCLTPALQGGETPLTDCRRVYRRIDPEIRARFEKKKWMYVRNFGDGLGLSWEDVFQTTDKAEVEQYCRGAEIEFEWKDDGGLRTRQIRPAIAKHPRTGELVWFNHATFFHVSTLEPEIREGLLTSLKEENLPNNTYYGDGTPIEESVLEVLREAYRLETTTFGWNAGDILIVDNMLVAHSRGPYTGERKILVGLGDLYRNKEK